MGCSSSTPVGVADDSHRHGSALTTINIIPAPPSAPSSHHAPTPPAPSAHPSQASSPTGSHRQSVQKRPVRPNINELQAKIAGMHHVEAPTSTLALPKEVLITSRNLANQATRLKKVNPQDEVYCSINKIHKASVYCTQCQASYCRECDAMQHGSTIGQANLHTRTAIKASSRNQLTDPSVNNGMPVLSYNGNADQSSNDANRQPAGLQTPSRRPQSLLIPLENAPQLPTFLRQTSGQATAVHRPGLSRPASVNYGAAPHTPTANARRHSLLPPTPKAADAIPAADKYINQLPVSILKHMGPNHLHQLWNDYDTDNSGYLDRSEIGVLATDCITLTLSLVEQDIIKQHPTITAKELAEAVQREGKFIIAGKSKDESLVQMRRKIIKQLDVNGDGKVSRTEFMTSFATLAAELFQIQQNDEGLGCSIM